MREGDESVAVNDQFQLVIRSSVETEQGLKGVAERIPNFEQFKCIIVE